MLFPAISSKLASSLRHTRPILILTLNNNLSESYRILTGILTVTTFINWTLAISDFNTYIDEIISSSGLKYISFSIFRQSCSPSRSKPSRKSISNTCTFSKPAFRTNFGAFLLKIVKVEECCNLSLILHYIILYFTFLFSLFVFVSAAGQYNVIWTGIGLPRFRFGSGTVLALLFKIKSII